MTEVLDPLMIARFFAMPGAVRLVESFSAIPPGPVRESIVAHAESLAEAIGYRGRTDPPPPPEPMIAWRGEKPAPVPLVSSSAEGQIVERILRGTSPQAVAQSLGIDVTDVFRLMAEARKEGVVFPGDAKPAPRASARGNPRKRRDADPRQVPPTVDPTGQGRPGQMVYISACIITPPGGKPYARPAMWRFRPDHVAKAKRRV